MPEDIDARNDELEPQEDGAALTPEDPDESDLLVTILKVVLILGLFGAALYLTYDLGKDHGADEGWGLVQESQR